MPGNNPEHHFDLDKSWGALLFLLTKANFDDDINDEQRLIFNGIFGECALNQEFVE